MKTVLLTGCSSGIGYDAAHFLRENGWRVLATCRQDHDTTRLRDEGFDSFTLDLASEDSVAAGVAHALSLGPVHALINNGAFALPGAVEDLPRGGLRAIFETNLFGTHDLTQRLIPHFREIGEGRIVHVSSVLGLVGIPWRGAYCATKFALEGLTDVLRVEMADTPIKVSLVQPGPIGTKIRLNSIPHFERWIDWKNSAREDQYRSTLLKRLYEPAAQKDKYELPPRAVSEKLLHAISDARPRPRYYVTRPTYFAGIGKRLLSTRALDWFAQRS